MVSVRSRGLGQSATRLPENIQAILHSHHPNKGDAADILQNKPDISNHLGRIHLLIGSPDMELCRQIRSLHRGPTDRIRCAPEKTTFLIRHPGIRMNDLQGGRRTQKGR